MEIPRDAGCGADTMITRNKTDKEYTILCTELSELTISDWRDAEEYMKNTAHECTVNIISDPESGVRNMLCIKAGPKFGANRIFVSYFHTKDVTVSGLIESDTFLYVNRKEEKVRIGNMAFDYNMNEHPEDTK